MSIYVKKQDIITELENIYFEKETELQELLFKYPQIIFNFSDLELDKEELAIKYREYSTSRGPIDNLYITKNGEIILVETKLIKNPEGIRTVIAQIVDYIKALTIDGCENILNKNCMSMEILDNFVPDDKFYSRLNKNFTTGSINGIIIGDDIHPNLLGLVESIQSAPHLGFHLSLLKIELYKNGNEEIICVKNIEKTKEVERSVIKISFENENIKPVIESETPSKTGKGSKAILTWEQYIDNVENQYKKIIEKYKKDWINTFGEGINMGSVGFSAGFFVGEKRYATMFVYDEKLEIITENVRNKNNVSDNTYLIYKKELEKSPDVYDKYLISGKTMVYYRDISITSLENILNASIIFAKEWQREINSKI